MQKLKLTPQEIARARQAGCGTLIDEMFPHLNVDDQFALSLSIRDQVFAKERKAAFRKLERQADRIGNYGRI